MFERFNSILKENLYTVSLLLSFILLLVLLYFTFNGAFEENVIFTSYEVGNKGRLFENGTNDYVMLTDFESKGAFIAGRKIHVSIDFVANRKADEFRKSELLVVLPGSTEFPLPRGLNRVTEAYVKLNFINETFAHGEEDIVYLMPELNLESAVVPFKTNGQYTYNLLINNVPQTPDSFIRTNPFLHVAPLETELQEQSGNLILMLTFVALYLSIVQIVISISSMKKENRLSQHQKIGLPLKNKK